MRWHLASLIAAAAIAHAATAGAAADPSAVPCLAATDSQPSWIFRPSRYSHDPATGGRVSQYAPKAPAYAPVDASYAQSGYRHIRSSLRGADGSADRMHVIQTWGAGENIRPYGEWQRPYRAGATPYGPWGNPQGPWTLPFESWQNPYGLGQLPHPPWPHWPSYPSQPVPYAGGSSPLQQPLQQPPLGVPHDSDHGTRRDPRPAQPPAMSR